MTWREFFVWLEQNPIGIWVSESPSLLAFPTILALHAIGMGLLAGTSMAMDLRLLGIARGVSLSSLERLVPTMRFGFWVNAVSGVLLLLAYPTKALTNPVFYLKLLLIALAMVDTWLIRKHIIRNSVDTDATARAGGRLLAVASLIFWAGAVFAGRFLAYTYRYLDADFDLHTF
jgi:hypothetical protein